MNKKYSFIPFFIYFKEVYSFLNAGIIPSYEYRTEDLVLSLGIAAYMSLNAEKNKTNPTTVLLSLKNFKIVKLLLRLQKLKCLSIICSAIASNTLLQTRL